MALKPQFSVSESFPSCDVLTITDITCNYNANSCKGGYGSPNIEKDAVSKTIFYLTPPNSDIEVPVNKNFLPSDNSCDNNGSFTISCIDYFIALGDIEPVQNTNNVSLTTDEPCGCPGEVIVTPVSVNTNTQEGCFVDGCWGVRYEVYAAGNTYTYTSVSNVAPNAVRITIDSVVYDLGYQATTLDMVNALNGLGFDIFVLSGNNIVVTGTHIYGNIESSNITYDFTAITYAAVFSVIINGDTFVLGTIGDSAALLTALNALNLGTWLFTDANTLTVYGFSTYGSIFKVSSEIPISATNTATITPTVSGAVDILVGSSSRKEFLYGKIAARIKNVGMKTFASPCLDCHGENLQDKYYALTQDFSTLLLASKGHTCNCQCSQSYLTKLQIKCSELENNCN